MRTQVSAPRALLALALLALAGCSAGKLRSHNIELESLLSTRAEALEDLRKAVRNSSPSVLEQERRLAQVKSDLAALAFDAFDEAQEIEDKATKVSYLFTAARAGSKAGGPILAEVFEDRIAASKAQEGANSASPDPAADPEAEDDPVDPFYFGIVVPAREVCASFENTWEKPARDCAYIEVVAHFAAIDEIVLRAQEIEDAGNPLPLARLDGIERAFDGLGQQFDRIEETSRDVISKTYKVGSDFTRYLDLQLLRTYCNAETMHLAFDKIEDASAEAAKAARKDRLDKMSDHLKSKRDSTLLGYMHDNDGGPDCGKARQL